jgi:hypothetical protein
MAKVEKVEQKIPSPNDIEWTDYVLSLLTEDEKIKGNPTTDGLRRVFETATKSRITDSSTRVLQCPEPDNGQRATVVVNITYVNDKDQVFSVDGASDAFWGNTDKLFRNHPVAVAETKAEGRALRRALKLRKVITADEIAEDVEDITGENADRIESSQINFIDNLSVKTNVNVTSLLDFLELDSNNIKKISHKDAVSVVRKLSEFQRDLTNIPENLLGYNPDWRD